MIKWLQDEHDDSVQVRWSTNASDREDRWSTVNWSRRPEEPAMAIPLVTGLPPIGINPRKKNELLQLCDMLVMDQEARDFYEGLIVNR